MENKHSKEEILAHIDWLTEIKEKSNDGVKNIIAGLIAALFLINFLIAQPYSLTEMHKEIFNSLYYYLVFLNLSITIFAYYNKTFREKAIFEMGSNDYTELDKKRFLLGHLCECLFMLIGILISIYIVFNKQLGYLALISITMYGIRHILSFVSKSVILYKNYYSDTISNNKHNETSFIEKNKKYRFRLSDLLYLFITFYPIYEMLIYKYDSLNYTYDGAAWHSWCVSGAVEITF